MKSVFLFYIQFIIHFKSENPIQYNLDRFVHSILNNNLYGRYNIDVKFTRSSIFSFFHKEQVSKIKNSDIIHFSSLFFIN